MADIPRIGEFEFWLAAHLRSRRLAGQPPTLVIEGAEVGKVDAARAVAQTETRKEKAAA